uniref:Altered inheritance of mitochondria protein 24, mitochondrial n=1 Tax=Blastobotrys adeninivorans TaxID=409370 RepID=A0A060TFV4_BLAAD
MRLKSIIDKLTPIMSRLIHVVQSPAVSIPTSLNVSHLIRAPEIKDSVDGIASAKFQVVGSSLLQVSLPPSTPLYTRRNSQVATFNTQEHSIVSSLYVGKALSRLLAWQRPFAFQRIESTVPVSTLLSSPKSLAVITLDGTIDWVIAAKNALHSFTGEQLIVNSKGPFRLRNRPRYVHTFLSGRGTVALSSKGDMYKVSLEQGERFLVLRDSLVAYSLDSNNRNAGIPQLKSIPHSLGEKADQPVVYDDVNESLWDKAKRYSSAVLSFVYRLVHADSGRYVEVKGPATVLLQSSVPFPLNSESLGVNLNANPLESKVHYDAKQFVEEKEYKLERAEKEGLVGRPEDHLKVVTVQNGKATFESTSSFDHLIRK